MRGLRRRRYRTCTLNESPSEKEGKCEGKTQQQIVDDPSMKVPPKRKGNAHNAAVDSLPVEPSMKVPPKRKGNWCWSQPGDE